MGKINSALVKHYRKQQGKTEEPSGGVGDSAYQGKDLAHIFSNHGIGLEIVKRPPGRRRIYNEEWRAE